MSKRKFDDDVFEYTGNSQTVPKDVVSVRIHPSIVKIEDEAFNRCEQLKEVVFNEGLQSIGESAFRYCKALQSISFPSTVTNVGEEAFSDCYSLKKVVLNEGFKKIGKLAFAHSHSLESINFPSTLEETGNMAFRGSHLKEVILIEGLKKVGSGSFDNCNSLERVTLSSSVVEIEEYAFHYSKWLREVALQESLQTIGDRAFSGCHSLESFTFPTISNRLSIIIQAGQYPSVEAKIDEVRGDVIERRGSDLFVDVDAMKVLDQWDIRTIVDFNWNPIKESRDKIVSWIRYYEINEAATLFELALWKANLDRASDMTREACRTRGKYRSTRDKYRAEVPGPVKDAILQYL